MIDGLLKLEIRRFSTRNRNGFKMWKMWKWIMSLKNYQLTCGDDDGKEGDVVVHSTRFAIAEHHMGIHGVIDILESESHPVLFIEDDVRFDSKI